MLESPGPESTWDMTHEAEFSTPRSPSSSGSGILPSSSQDCAPVSLPMLMMKTSSVRGSKSDLPRGASNTVLSSSVAGLGDAGQLCGKRLLSAFSPTPPKSAKRRLESALSASRENPNDDEEHVLFSGRPRPALGLACAETPLDADATCRITAIYRSIMESETTMGSSPVPRGFRERPEMHGTREVEKRKSQPSFSLAVAGVEHLEGAKRELQQWRSVSAAAQERVEREGEAFEADFGGRAGTTATATQEEEEGKEATTASIASTSSAGGRVALVVGTGRGDSDPCDGFLESSGASGSLPPPPRGSEEEEEGVHSTGGVLEEDIPSTSLHSPLSVTRQRLKYLPPLQLLPQLFDLQHQHQHRHRVSKAEKTEEGPEEKTDYITVPSIIPALASAAAAAAGEDEDEDEALQAPVQKDGLLCVCRCEVGGDTDCSFDCGTGTEFSKEEMLYSDSRFSPSPDTQPRPLPESSPPSSSAGAENAGAALSLSGYGCYGGAGVAPSPRVHKAGGAGRSSPCAGRTSLLPPLKISSSGGIRKTHPSCGTPRTPAELIKLERQIMSPTRSSRRASGRPSWLIPLTQQKLPVLAPHELSFQYEDSQLDCRQGGNALAK